MSVKVCPECEAEYVATVEECADCGATLVVAEEPEADDTADDDAGATDTGTGDGEDSAEVAQLGYELDEWDGNGRVLLDQLLTGQGIVHVWEGTTLVVRAADEDAVDILIEQVEAADLPELDPDRAQVVYELEGWSEERRAALVEALVEEALPHALDEDDDLVVHEDDEEQIEDILDRIDTASASRSAPDEDEDEDEREGEDDDEAADETDEDDGLAAQDAMSELFVAADRLMHDPDDHEGVLSLGDAARMVESLGLPYGFAPAVWKDITARAVALRELLEAVETDDDEVIEAATGLRTVLRQYV
jgi:hypothetical protein